MVDAISDIEKYIIDMQNDRTLSDKTKMLYKETLTKLTTYMSENNINTLNKQIIDGFINDIEQVARNREKTGIALGRTLTDDTLKPTTYNRYISAIRRFLLYTNDVKLAKQLKSAKDNPKFDIIEFESIKKVFQKQTITEYYLWKSPNSRNPDFYVERMCLLINFVFSVGLRSEETHKLKKEHLKLGRAVPVVEVTGKGGTTRVVELSKKWILEYEEFLSKYKQTKESEYVFTTFSGGQLSYSTIKSYVKSVGFFINVPRLSMHKLRHCYALMNFEENGDIRELSRRLGHKDIKTTMIYLSHIINKKVAFVSPFDNI